MAVSATYISNLPFKSPATKANHIEMEMEPANVP